MPSFQQQEQVYDSLSQGEVQDIWDGEGTIRGFKQKPHRLIIFHLLNILTFGIPWLMGHWYPSWKVKLISRPCPLMQAQFILLTDENGVEFVCSVETEAGGDPFYPESTSKGSKGRDLCSALNSHNLNPLRRHFTFRHEKFVWSEGEESFEIIYGLQNLTAQEILNNFSGLSHSQRLKLRCLYGLNSIHVDVKSYWRLLVDEVLNPFYVFQILSVILWCFDEYIYYATCVVIISAISISISLVETKTQSQMLKDMAQGSEHTLITLRTPDGQEEVVMSNEVVPGDVILIPPEGFIMPCDGVLVHGSCIVNESMLTGESIPVQKSALTPSNNLYNPDTHKRHTLFAGTQIIQTRFYPGNKVSCVVVRTGYSTLKGQLIRSILFPKELDFKFYADAMKFVLLLFGCATFGMIYCVYLYVHRATAWYVTVIRVLDIVTIVVPPALPAAMTVGTVYAQARLRAQQIFCISPPRINFCGKLKLMCFDKTGTLTEEGLDLWCVVPVGKKTSFEGEQSEFEFLEAVEEPRELELSSPLLRAMASCHSLTYIHGNLVGDPLDLKMFASTEWELEEPLGGEGDTHKFDLLTPTVVKKDELEVGIIREFEFTPQLQRMSVVVRSMDGPNMILYSKGAPEKIIPLCIQGVPDNFDKVLDSFTVKGYRVLALAWKPLKKLPWHKIQIVQRDALEKELIFSGFLVMQNSLKPATNRVIEELISASIRCVMVTGDNVLTALSVARECGIIPSCDKVILVNAREDGKTEFSLAAQHYEETVPRSKMNNNMRTPEGASPSSTSSVGRRDGYTELIDAEPELEFHPNSTEGMIPFKSLSHTILDLQQSNYHFVMNGRSWTLLLENAPPEELERIISKGTVFARMSPENKSQLVEALQGIGYVVGMCGDGANDCSALKMAHVGISLSEAEASVAAPFTSKIPDVSCVPKLIREGRCALVTSFSIFKYMALYSMVQFSSVIILYTYKTNLGDTQFLYIDLGITTTIAVVMGRTAPFPRLVSQRPMGSLVSFQNVFSIISQILISLGIQIGGITYLQNQPWYLPLNPSSPDELQSLCWETTTIFSISTFQYLILALVFSKGPPFRKPFYSNGMFMVCYAVLMLITTLLVVYPFEFLASFFYLEPIEENTSYFRWTLLLFPALNLALSLVFEHHWTSGFVKRLGRILLKKTEKNRYKIILRNLEEDSTWPPLKSTIN